MTITPDPAQIVVHGNVRVSVLTERLLRIEYAQDGVFEDRPSIDVATRHFPRVPFRTSTDGDAIAVDTGAVVLHYDDTTRPPTGKRLHAEIHDLDGGVTWRYGQRGRGNLGGTVRTLDGWDGDARARFVDFDPATGVVNAWDRQKLEPGLLSTGGWVVVDDSASVLVESRRGRSAAARPHAVPRAPGTRTDLYLFAYGTDHKAALEAASHLFGPQPLPPRWAFGYWYSRYYPYTDRELLDLCDSFDAHDVPADVLVIDMDWHRPGWTGYSWDRDLFVDPTATLAAVHAHRLRVALNLHPADGVGSHEDAHRDMCAALGLDPDTTDRIPFDLGDPAFVDAYFRLLHHPEEDRGVDVWWIDWQQGTGSAVPGLDPLAWLNLLHTDDQSRRRPGRRPLILSRWGGLGSTRQPLGFSGDTYATWESLAFQPYFTATAANVGYGYWSHDIGGHFQTEPDAELYTRWIQFGVHSPVLRTHGSLDAHMERRVWEYPNPYRDVMIAALRRRYELIPYLYTEARQGVDTGLSLVRPMYHDHPDQRGAYRAPGQYQFGDVLIVAPVTTPVDDDAMAEVRTWLPEGEWFDIALGRRVSVTAPGGRRSTERYLLDEVPTFAPAGAVVPTQHGVRRLDTSSYPNLVITAFGGGDGDYELYSDDGVSTGYQRGRSVSLPLAHRTRARARSVSIGPAEGSYPGWSRRRPVEVRFVAEAPPRAVRVDDREVAWSPTRMEGHWSYDARTASVVVTLPRVNLRATTVVTLERTAPRRRREIEALLDGYPGLHRRVERLADATRVLVGDDNRRIMHLVQTPDRIDRDPAVIGDELRDVRAAIADVDAILDRATTHHSDLESLNPLDPPRATDALRAARRLLATTRRQFPS